MIMSKITIAFHNYLVLLLISEQKKQTKRVSEDNLFMLT